MYSCTKFTAQNIIILSRKGDGGGYFEPEPKRKKGQSSEDRLSWPVALSTRRARKNKNKVEVSSVTWRDWDTGQESDFAGVNCDAFYYDGAGAAGAGATSDCVLGGIGGVNVASGAGAEEGCKNALASVCYTVRKKEI